MGARERLNHLIKINRQMRKAKQYNYNNQYTHPALLNDWDDLSRDEQSKRLYRWKILINKK